MAVRREAAWRRAVTKAGHSGTLNWWVSQATDVFWQTQASGSSVQFIKKLCLSPVNTWQACPPLWKARNQATLSEVVKTKRKLYNHCRAQRGASREDGFKYMWRRLLIVVDSKSRSSSCLQLLSLRAHTFSSTLLALSHPDECGLSFQFSAADQGRCAKKWSPLRSVHLTLSAL